MIGLANGTGNIKTSYNYSPFGKKQTTGASSDNPFTFTGREDDGTGLYYYRARYYSPDQKRFIAADPLGFGGGDSNFYAYVGNNPINFTDPSGESFESFAQGLAVGGATGFATSFMLGALAAATGVTIGPVIAAVLALGGGALLIAAINEIANEPCPDKRDYLLGALIGGAVGGGLGAKLGGGLGAGLRGNVAKGLAGVPGRVQSRINLSNKGMKHVIDRHLSGKANASQFSIAETELRGVLQSREAVSSPVVRMVESTDGIRYLREFDAGRAIGVDKFNGNQATSVMTIMTDRFGNLVTTFPGLLK